jgi:hypothetical protein
MLVGSWEVLKEHKIFFNLNYYFYYVINKLIILLSDQH